MSEIPQVPKAEREDSLSINVKEFNKESLLKEAEKLRFKVSDIHAQILPVLDHVEQNYEDGSVATLKDLTLEFKEREIITEEALSNFLEGTSVDGENLFKFKKAVEELESAKDIVLTEFRRLGHESAAKDESSKMENLDPEVASLSDQIKDLEREFLTRVGKNNSSSLKVAQVTFKLLTGPQDTDPNIAKGNKQRRLKKIRKMLEYAQEELAELVKRKEEEEASKPQEKTESKAIVDLAELYRSATDGVIFKEPNSINGDEYKSFEVIALEIHLILEHFGLDNKKIDTFTSEVLEPARSEISNYNRIINSKAYQSKGVSKAKMLEKAELEKERRQTYDKLLAAVKTALSESQVLPESVKSVEAPVEKSISDAEIEQQIKSCSTFEELYFILEKLGGITDEKNNFYTSEQLRSQIEEVVTKFEKYVKHLELNRQADVENNYRLKNALLYYGDSIIKTAGLRDQVKKLLSTISVVSSGAEEASASVADKKSDNTESGGEVDTALTDSDVTKEKTELTLEEKQNLYNLYRAADSNVFEDPNQVGKFKPFSIVRAQIRKVLEYAGLEKVEVDEFMNPIEVDLHDQIKDLNLKLQDGDMIKPEYAKTLIALKRQVSKKYQDLLNKVAAKIKEVESSKIALKVPATSERIEESLSTVSNFDDLDKVLDELEGIQGSRKYYPVADLKSEISKIREVVKTLIKTHPDVGIDAIIEMTFHPHHPKFSILTNSGGLRDVVKRLVEEENAIIKKTDQIAPAKSAEDQASTLSEQVLTKGGLSPESLYLRKMLSKSRENYLKIESEYNSKLEKFYSDSSWKTASRRGLVTAANFFGLSPELTPELGALKQRLSIARQLYAEVLDTNLLERSKYRSNQSSDGEVKRMSTTDAAFAKRFILEPHQKLLEAEEKGLSLESRSRLGRIMTTVAKSSVTKWGMRLILTALAGVTGGVAAAGIQGGRMAISALGGSAAAGIAYKLMDKNVEQKELNLERAKNAAIEKFSLEYLAGHADDLERAQRQIRVSRQRQKAAAVAAAVIAGGVSGATAEAFGVGVAGEIDVTNAVSAVPSDTNLENPVNEDINPQSSSNEAAVASKVESPDRVEIETVAGGGESLKLNDLHIVNEGLNKEYGATDIKNVRLMGAFDDVKLTIEEQTKINDLIQRESQILAIKPNISEMVFEKYLFVRMSEQFGQEDWWIGAQPKGIDLDLLRVDPEVNVDEVSVDREVSPAVPPEDTSEATSMDTVGETAPETSPTPEVAKENIYTVQRGDNLWKIAAQYFEEELKNVPPEQYNIVLDKVFDNIESSAELKQSLGIKSGDIDLIYPNEQLNLTAVGEEIKRVLAETNGLEESDLGSESVTAQNDLENSLARTEDTGWRGYEATPEQIFTASGNANVLPPTEVVPVAGQYFNQTEWKEYVTQRFGSEVAFNKVLTAEIDHIDNLKSDFLSRLFGGDDYKSPFNVMSKMTIEELNDLRENPDFNERAFCEKHNLKYETYRDWQNLIANLKDNYDYDKATTWEDMFKRHVAETLAPKLKDVTT